MKKLTDREIARLLAARATPVPPAGLADRIKAEIPGMIRIERRPARPDRRWLMPPLVEGLRPSWLAAVSVLFVLGVGIVAARIPAPPDDVWKWMALSGVVHIDDVVVTAPAPAESQAGASLAPRQVARAARVTVPSRPALPSVAPKAEEKALRGERLEEKAPAAPAPEPQTVAAIATTATEARDAARGGAEAARSDRIAVTGGTGVAALDAAPPRPRAAGGIVVSGAPAPVAASGRRAEAIAAVSAPQRAEDEVGLEENTVTVLVTDDFGQPRQGVTVTLERISQGAAGRRIATTDATGTATFRDVPIGTYHAVAAATTVVPAQVVFAVTSERTPTRAAVRVRALPRR